MVRCALKVCLEAAGIKVVGEAADGMQTLSLIPKVTPDVAVIDHLMPKLNGIEAARQILREFPHTRILILTMCAEERLVLEAMRAGVLGYMLKSEAIDALVDAVQRIARKEVYLSPSLACFVVQAFRDKTKMQTDPLSGRERQVLQLVAEGQTTKGIAEILGISVKTAETHRSHLIEKLDIHDTAGLVRYAIRQGITQP
jgi:DNA-binding NarL/FixJ family response regulator